MTRTLTVLALALVLGACNSSPLRGVGDWFADARELEVTEFGRSTLCGSQDDHPRVRLFQDISRFEAWREERGIEFAGFEQAGDDRIVVIEQGRRPTAGYQVAVSRVAELRGSELSLHVTMLSPRPGAMTAQMITSPCVVVGVPRVDIRKLRVIDQSGEQRAVWYR